MTLKDHQTELRQKSMLVYWRDLSLDGRNQTEKNLREHRALDKVKGLFMVLPTLVLVANVGSPGFWLASWWEVDQVLPIFLSEPRFQNLNPSFNAWQWKPQTQKDYLINYTMENTSQSRAFFFSFFFFTKLDKCFLMSILRCYFPKWFTFFV